MAASPPFWSHEETATKNPDGTPIWFELSTSDKAKAQNFYAATIGWTITPSAMAEHSGYLIASTPDSAAIAGITTPPANAPSLPDWSIYFGTSDASRSAMRYDQDPPCFWYDGTAENGATSYAATSPTVASMRSSRVVLVYTDDQTETDCYWNAIVDNSGAESACGLCKDRWGVNWQITPRVLIKAIDGTDTAVAARAFGAMTTMHKIDIAAMEAAIAGGTAYWGRRPGPTSPPPALSKHALGRLS